MWPSCSGGGLIITAERSQANSREALLLAVFFGVLFLASVDNQLLIPLLPRIGESLGTSLASLAWFFSGYALAAAVFNVLLGPLTDRFGRVLFLRLGLAGMGVLTLGAYFSTTFGELLALRCATGLAAGLLSTCVAGLVGDYFPYHRRGRAMGIVLSSYFLALILGVPLGVSLAEAFGWRSIFLATCGGSVLLVLGALGALRSTPSDEPIHWGFIFRQYRRFMTRRLPLGALLASFAVSGATLAMLTFISGLGLSPRQISWLFLVSGLAALAGSPLAGWLSDRWGKRQVFLAGNTLTALPMAALPWIPVGAALLAVFFGLSLLIAARQTALQTLHTELAGESSRGAFLGLRNGFSQFGISVSVWVAGLLFEPYGYAGVAAFAAGLTLTASLLLWIALPRGLLEG